MTLEELWERQWRGKLVEENEEEHCMRYEWISLVTGFYFDVRTFVYTRVGQSTSRVNIFEYRSLLQLKTNATYLTQFVSLRF